MVAYNCGLTTPNGDGSSASIAISCTAWLLMDQFAVYYFPIDFIQLDVLEGSFAYNSTLFLHNRGFDGNGSGTGVTVAAAAGLL